MDRIEARKALRMKRFLLAGCASLLVLNGFVGVTVMCYVASINQGTQIRHTNTLMQGISRIYDEQLTKMNGDGTGDPKDPNGGNQQMTPAMVNLLKPIAYFTGLDFDGHIDDHNATAIRDWESFAVRGRQLKYNGMRYENGSFIVPATGVYAVYSHVQFYTETNRQGDTEIDFHHSIMRYNALEKTYEPALSDIMSENKNDVIDGGSLEYSSNIHGILQLNAGDQLIVKVSHWKPLQTNRDWHYFGVYMI